MGISVAFIIATKMFCCDLSYHFHLFFADQSDFHRILPVHFHDKVCCSKHMNISFTWFFAFSAVMLSKAFSTISKERERESLCLASAWANYFCMFLFCELTRAVFCLLLHKLKLKTKPTEKECSYQLQRYSNRKCLYRFYMPALCSVIVIRTGAWRWSQNM